MEKFEDNLAFTIVKAMMDVENIRIGKGHEIPENIVDLRTRLSRLIGDPEKQGHMDVPHRGTMRRAFMQTEQLTELEAQDIAKLTESIRTLIARLEGVTDKTEPAEIDSLQKFLEILAHQAIATEHRSGHYFGLAGAA